MTEGKSEKTLGFNNIRELREDGYALREPPLMLLTYDPAGDGDDRDGLILLAREEWRRGELWDPDLAIKTIFRVTLAMRMPPDYEVPDKIAHILAAERNLRRWQAKRVSAGHIIAVETNGVGYGIFGGIKEKLPHAKLISYTTVARINDDRFQSGRISIPRLPALDHMRALLETHYLKADPAAPGVKELHQEMNAFVWRGAGRPEALEGQHDDLVMPLSAGCWIGTRLIPPMTKQMKFPNGNSRDTTRKRNDLIRIR